MTTDIMVALISACAAIASSAIACASILYAAKRVVSRKKLRLQLIEAYKDILFLTEVENAHVEINIAQHGKSNKLMIRDAIRNEKLLLSSGNNTPSAVRRKLNQLSSFDD